MKKTLLLLLAFMAIAMLFLSCGYSSPSSSSSGPVSGLAYRAYVTQDVTGGAVGAGILIIDAQNDLLSGVHEINAGNTPGMMLVTPNRNQTLVFSGNGTQQSDNLFSIINNATENNARQINLGSITQSFVVSPDSNSAYIALPTAQTPTNPGTLVVVNLGSGSVSAQVDIPGIKYLSISHNGNRILGFSDNFDSVWVITPSEIGNGNPVTPVAGFDRPVQAFFSNDDNTAFVINCGAGCTGAQASVQPLDLTNNIALTAISVPAAEAATVVNTTMYLAGTPVPPSPCTGQQTQATTCGLLTVFDLTKMQITNTSPIILTDGYHDHIAMGANGQLFIGAHNCTEILPTPQNNNERRGCLSIFDTSASAVVIPPASGDVTGLQPVANRSVVYLVQGGEMQIYDTGTDKLQARQVDISGTAVDVVTVDH